MWNVVHDGCCLRGDHVVNSERDDVWEKDDVVQWAKR